MPLPAVLAQYIATAHHAVREVGQHLDPSIPLRRAAWAVAEIAGKIDPAPEIDAAIQGVHRALDATLTKANHVALVTNGLADEQEASLAAIATLETALARARPNATAMALGLAW